MSAIYTQEYQTNGRPVTNPALIRGMQSDFDPAWSHLYSVYWEWLVRIAVSRGIPHEDAKDLVACTFIALSKHISGFIYEPAKGRFSGWLLTVLDRKIADRWRANQRDPLNLLPADLNETAQSDPLAGLPDPAGGGLIDQVLVNELEQMMRKAYQELQEHVTAQHWAIFEAYNIQELPVEDVAARFGLQSGSVYGINCRMVRQLRQIATRMLEIA